MEFIIAKAIRDHKDSKVITSKSSDHIWLRALLLSLFTAIAFVAGKQKMGAHCPVLPHPVFMQSHWQL